VVLIDGGAGSGKTTLAAQLAESWPGIGPAVVSLDEFYPGWQGLAAGAMLVPEVITGDSFLTWDWTAGRPGVVRELDRTAPLIVEGCGAITPGSRALATVSIWLEQPAHTRRERALARDGEMFAPHWDQWAAQEADHWRRNRPWELADFVLTGR
jgi:uridine kinase